jgi:multiple sugar transport system substrate-binding protein
MSTGRSATRWIAVALLLTVSLFVTPTQPALAQRPFAGKTLTVWIGGHIVEQEALWKKIVSDFEAKTGARVDYTLIGFQVYYDKLVGAFAAGSPPDVSFADLGGWVPTFEAKGWLEPLTERLATWEGTGQIWPNIWSTVTYNGVRYGVPWYTDCRVLLYNKQMFQDAGLDPATPPVTWDDLLRDAQKLTQPAKGIYGYGVSGIKNELATLGYMMFLGGNGGRLLSADYSHATFNTPQGVEALKIYTELYTKYRVSPPGTPNQGEDDYRTAMAQGRVAMAVGGPWSFPLIETANPAIKGEYAVALHPYKTTPYSVLGGWASVIAQQSKEKDLAWEFIAYITSKDVWLYWLTQSGGPLPTRRDVTKESPLFSDPRWKVILDTFPKADVRPPIPQWPQVSNEIQLMVQNALTGRASPEEAVRTAAGNVDRILGAR